LGAKYTTQSASGYNSSPPSDDGTQSESNKVKWSTVKTKLADPVKALVDSINTALLAVFDLGPNSQSTAYVTVAGDHLKTIQCTAAGGVTLLAATTAGAGYTVTISNQHSAAITITRSGSDTINGASKNISVQPGQEVTLKVNAAANGYLTSLTPLLADVTDPSKQVLLALSGITTGTSRTITVPDRNITLDDRGWVLLGTASASNSATVDFASGITSTYDEYVVLVSDLVSATDNVSLVIRISQSAVFAGGASDYAWTRYFSSDGSAVGSANDADDSSITITAGVSNSKSLRAQVYFSAPAGASRSKVIGYSANFEPSGASVSVTQGTGLFKANTTAIDGIRFLMSSGNITAGNFALYGIRKT
jgi:hypothetical protein